MFNTVARGLLRPRVIITAKIPEVGVKKVAEACDIVHHWDREEALPREELLKMAKGVEGVLCILSDKIDKEFLDVATEVKVVSTMSVGFDHIDLAACTSHGIKVGNTPGVLTETTADLVVTLLLATARRIPEAYQAVKQGTWPKTWGPEWMCGKDVHHSTVGIVGMGRIGQAVARRLGGFGCRILFTARKPTEFPNTTQVDLGTLLAKSDFVIPLVPLNNETKGMFNESLFRMMKRDAFLINASRGPIVDQEALVAAIREGVIGGCGLDVTTPEPLPMDHPLLAPDLIDRVVVLPHIGSASYATRGEMAMIAANNLISGLNRETMKHPLN